MKVARVTAAALLLALALLAAGCGSSVRSLPPAEIVQNAVKKMEGTTGFHFNLDKVGSVKVINFDFDIREVDGDVQPERLRAKLGATLMNALVNLQVINVGKQTFLSNPFNAAQWMELSGESNPMGFLDPLHGVVTILRELQNVKLVDVEKVEGVETYHVQGVTKAQAKKSLFGSYAGDEDISTDAWIDSKDFSVVKMRFSGSFLQGEPKDAVRNLVLSRFNQAISIDAPAR